MSGLASFENESGEGVVSFEPSRWNTPQSDEEGSSWYCHLTVAGERVFEYVRCDHAGALSRKKSGFRGALPPGCTRDQRDPSGKTPLRHGSHATMRAEEKCARFPAPSRPFPNTPPVSKRGSRTARVAG